MHVELYERIWMWAAGGLLVLFVGMILFTATADAVRPPSHVEMVDPANLANYPEWANPGVNKRPDGRVVVSGVAQTFSFSPDPIEVPANQPITFRLTSSDVIHGFQVIGTNANVEVV